jgi:hypothetical protein
MDIKEADTMKSSSKYWFIQTQNRIKEWKA